MADGTSPAMLVSERSSAGSTMLACRWWPPKSREVTRPSAPPQAMPSQWQQSMPVIHDRKASPAFALKERFSWSSAEAWSGRHGIGGGTEELVRSVRMVAAWACRTICSTVSSKGRWRATLMEDDDMMIPVCLFSTIVSYLMMNKSWNQSSCF
uniref:Uncharacterized protein n=1 Tax=Oryza nivara TaxID=4536 RepID=A0A0E0HXY9_ORYNI